MTLHPDPHGRRRRALRRRDKIDEIIEGAGPRFSFWGAFKLSLLTDALSSIVALPFRVIFWFFDKP